MFERNGGGRLHYYRSRYYRQRLDDRLHIPLRVSYIKSTSIEKGDGEKINRISTKAISERFKKIDKKALFVDSDEFNKDDKDDNEKDNNPNIEYDESRVRRVTTSVNELTKRRFKRENDDKEIEILGNALERKHQIFQSSSRELFIYNTVVIHIVLLDDSIDSKDEISAELHPFFE